MHNKCKNIKKYIFKQFYLQDNNETLIIFCHMHNLSNALAIHFFLQVSIIKKAMHNLDDDIKAC